MPSYRPGRAAPQVEAEHGVANAVKMASNEHPQPPLAPIVEAVSQAAQQLHLYADHRASAVRERLADLHGVSAERVTVGAGSASLLQQLCLAYLDPGDTVVYPWRSFEVYPVFTQLMGGVAIEVPLGENLGPDIQAVADAVDASTKIVFLATPNNPTGVATAVDELRHLVERVPLDTIVCVDEAYREFVDPSYGDPVTELLDDAPNLVVTRTFSKAHGLAGARVGYAIGHRDVIATIDKTQMPFAVSSLAQAAALAALDHLDEIDALTATIIAERRRVEQALADHGWSLPNHQGNFIWLATGDDTDRIATELERVGVIARPFSGDGLRVTVSSPAHNDRFVQEFCRIASP